MPQRVDLTNPTGMRELQATKQLKRSSFSGHGTPAGCSPHPHWDTPLPTQSSSWVPEFGGLPGGTKGRPDFLKTRNNRQLGPAKEASAHPGPTKMTAIRSQNQETGYVNTVVARWAKAQKNRYLCRQNIYSAAQAERQGPTAPQPAVEEAATSHCAPAPPAAS